ncbi:Cytochrome C and Quinol oxidase polypeptide I [Lutibacter oricola]|uniref:Cytochrome C and Quinol oxidase polypeptide I n=1 Tax=Lutibacter oricola TaxID=762486 RepID=A0A1H2YXR6_9FLAO|nr:hypothetical protein [Lutibacter oricola]SDX09926.1 Cytochrome C and Quinol oxidase polypeptide I [Lutibacter oricola]
MNGLQTNNAPHSSVVVPHFIFGAISLLVLAVLIILADESLLQAYFNTKLIAITHIAVLGWASMIVFGALYQLVPVVFETALFSEKLAKVTFWFSAVSVLFLSYSFWVGSYVTLLPYASICMFLSLLLFVVNILLTYKNATLKNIKSTFVITSVFWLLITELIGTLIALNFKFNFLSEIHLHYLKIHATIGLIGWFVLLIIGVGATLIPMFLISHELKEKKLTFAYYLVNGGLIVAVINWFLFKNELIDYLIPLLIISGVLFFVSFIYDSYKKRLRKKLDVGMQYSMLAIAAIFVPFILIGFIVLNTSFEVEFIYRIITFYGFSIVFGLITTLILGQTYKTLPFIVWLNKYQKLVGKTKTPLPRELYSEKIANIQIIIYFVFIASFVIGLLFNQLLFIKIGSYALLLVAILYNVNIFKMITHKVKSVEND